MIAWNINQVKNPLIIYHKNCTDGHTAAWMFGKLFEKAEYFQSYHGDEIPDVKDRDVIILDFSYSREKIEEIQKSAKSFLLIDHHVSAQKELDGLSNCIIDLNYSASALVFDFCYKINSNLFKGKATIPNYVSDKDLWKFELKHSKEFNAFLSVLPMTFKKWDEIENDIIKNNKFQEMVEGGEIILKIQEKIVKDICSHSFKSTIYVPKIGQQEISVVNASCYYTECANYLAKNSLFAIAYFRREDKKYAYSLRTLDDNFDVSEVARFHGGGGHKKAAGFTSSVDIF